jgi:hypothetical protein
MRRSDEAERRGGATRRSMVRWVEVREGTGDWGIGIVDKEKEEEEEKEKENKEPNVTVKDGNL